MSGDASPLLGAQYAGQRIVGASFVGAESADAKAALEEAGFQVEMLEISRLIQMKCL